MKLAAGDGVGADLSDAAFEAGDGGGGSDGAASE